MLKERVIIRNNKNEKLVGYLYKNSSKTLLIVCHGLDTVNGFPGVDEVLQIYHSSGTSVFSFDFSGYGESEGKKKLSLKQRISEIRSVIDYFSADYKEIILYGVSLGAISAALAASKFSQVTKLITVNGFFSFNPRNFTFNQAITTGTFLLVNPKLWPEVLYLLRNFKIDAIAVPTTVVYGEKDEIVNPLQSIYFYNKLKTDKNILSVKNGDHAFLKGDYFDTVYKIHNWIKKSVI